MNNLTEKNEVQISDKETDLKSKRSPTDQLARWLEDEVVDENSTTEGTYLGDGVYA